VVGGLLSRYYDVAPVRCVVVGAGRILGQGAAAVLGCPVVSPSRKTERFSAHAWPVVICSIRLLDRLIPIINRDALMSYLVCGGDLAAACALGLGGWSVVELDGSHRPVPDLASRIVPNYLVWLAHHHFWLPSAPDYLTQVQQSVMSWFESLGGKISQPCCPVRQAVGSQMIDIFCDALMGGVMNGALRIRPVGHHTVASPSAIYRMPETKQLFIPQTALYRLASGALVWPVGLGAELCGAGIGCETERLGTLGWLIGQDFWDARWPGWAERQRASRDIGRILCCRDASS